MSARRSMLPELARSGGASLERVNGAYEAAQQVALLTGAPIGGGLVASIGAQHVFWVDALSFVLCALSVACLRISVLPRPGRPTPQREYLQELVAGWRFLRADSTLLALALSVALVNVLGGGSAMVLWPLYARTTFGSALGFGVMVGAIGAGSLLGAVLFALVGRRLPRRWVLVGAMALLPAQYWMIWAGVSLLVFTMILLVVGIVVGALNPLGVTIRQERTPFQLRGRVFSSFSAITGSTPAIGSLLAGATVTRLGLASAAAAFGLAGAAITVGVATVPALRRLDLGSSDSTLVSRPPRNEPG